MNEALKSKYGMRKINSHRLSALNSHAGDTILDVGCGSGAYVLELRGQKNIRGVDYQKFDTWDEAPELFSIASADDLSALPDNSVDTICSFEVLEHMKDPEKVLREYHRVCRNNIIITVPNCTITKAMKHSLLIYYHWIDPTHVNFFVRDKLIEITKNSGFEIDKFYNINQVNLLPILLENFGLDKKSPKDLRVRLLSWIYKRFSRKKYFITMLMVAKKV